MRALAPPSRRHLLGAAVVLVVGVLAVEPALAQASNNVLDELTRRFRDQAAGWEGRIASAAQSLFWLLAFIEVAITAVSMTLSASTLEQWVGALVRRVLFIGFFAFVLFSGPTYAHLIVDSLRQLGADAAGLRTISPSTVVDAGLATVEALLGDLGLLDALTPSGIMRAISVVIASLAIVICFAMVGAMLILALVESYVAIAAGIVLLGFGASRFTKDFAVKYLTYAFSVGIKLMVLALIIGLGQGVITDAAQAAATTGDMMGPFLLVALSIVFFFVVMGVPNTIQAIVNGVSAGGNMELAGGVREAARYGAAAAGAAASGFAGGLAGGVIGTAAATGAARHAARAEGGSTAGQLAGAVGRAALDKAAGVPGARHASTLGLATSRLREKAGR